MIDMNKFGLIGYPISFSLSPRLFNAAYSGKYVYDLIEEPSFDKAWEIFDKEYQAVNVTAPFKVLAAQRADICAPEVQKIGAANILVHTDKGIVAHNSDYLGVLAVLEEAFGDACAASGATALIVGYGGAGMAAAQAAKDLGMDVVICNRTLDKAVGIRSLEEIPLLAAVSDMLIYCIPQAIPEMKGVKVPMILEAKYKDPCLLDAASSRYFPGTAWHLNQAVKGYEIMSGEVPDVGNMALIYR